VQSSTDLLARINEVLFLEKVMMVKKATKL